MGSRTESSGAVPVHEVCLDGFWMGRHEVTNRAYGKCVAAGACAPAERRGSGINYHHRTGNDDDYAALGEALNAPDHPVLGVSWMDARAFARWLSETAVGTFRLPTEAEWEYACRGGGRNQRFAGGDSVERVGWYEENSGGKPHRVGIKAPNDLGLFDMSGNVWEWVEDVFVTEGYAQHRRKNPLVRAKRKWRVSRGGSWSGAVEFLSCYYRGVGDKADRDDNMGFRLLRIDPNAEPE